VVFRIPFLSSLLVVVGYRYVLAHLLPQSLYLTVEQCIHDNLAVDTAILATRASCELSSTDDVPVPNYSLVHTHVLSRTHHKFMSYEFLWQVWCMLLLWMHFVINISGKPNKGRHQMSKEQRSRKLLCYPTSIALLKRAQYSFLLFISGFVDGALWVRNLIGWLLRAQVVTKILRTGTVIICPSL
jgi:hypothetical protein